jgi:hypothetical protein
MKRIIVISTSLRHGSNSDILADKFVEGAKAFLPLLGIVTYFLPNIKENSV